jgi:hypothetical protein
MYEGAISTLFLPDTRDHTVDLPELALLLVLLPSSSHNPQHVHLFLGGLREQVSVDTRVKDPIPILLGDVGNEPGDLQDIAGQY